jgi:hypothetical protein
VGLCCLLSCFVLQPPVVDLGGGAVLSSALPPDASSRARGGGVEGAEASGGSVQGTETMAAGAGVGAGAGPAGFNPDTHPRVGAKGGGDCGAEEAGDTHHPDPGPGGDILSESWGTGPRNRRRASTSGSGGKGGSGSGGKSRRRLGRSRTSAYAPPHLSIETDGVGGARVVPRPAIIGRGSDVSVGELEGTIGWSGVPVAAAVGWGGVRYVGLSSFDDCTEWGWACHVGPRGVPLPWCVVAMVCCCHGALLP